MFNNKDILVTSVVFGDGGIQIGFLEARHQAEIGGIEQVLTVLEPKEPQLIADIQEALAGMVEDFITDLRNPPDTLPTDPKERLRARFTQDVLDADDEEVGDGERTASLP